MQAYVSRRKAPGTAARIAAVLALLLGWLGATAEPVDFRLLPALESERAITGLLLEIDRRGDRLIVVGEQGHILWSPDNGASWAQAEVPVSLAITSVAFASGDRAWATAHDGYLLHSTDGGTTWSIKLSGSDVASLSIGPIESQVAELRSALEEASDDTREDIEWALDEALFALDDATLAVDEGMTAPLLKVWFSDENTGYALGAYNTFLRTDDGGETWASYGERLDNPDKYHLYSMTRSANGTLLVAGEAGTLQRSLDDGASWEAIESPYPGSFFGTVDASDGSLLIFGLRGNVFRSTDEGVSWAAVATGDNRTLMCGDVGDDGSIVLAGAAGAVLRSVDAGTSFSVIPTEGNRVYSDVLIEPEGGILLVGFGGISALTPGDDDE